MINKILKDVFIPNLTFNTSPIVDVLSRTTHLCICAHQDDTEIMVYHGISECFQKSENFFTTVIVTDGLGSDKSDIYKTLSDEEFIALRKNEQKKAAIIGEYNAVIFLPFSSSILKKSSLNVDVSNCLGEIINLCSPKFIYTHSPFDSHLTHSKVCKNVIDSLTKLNSSIIENIDCVYGCEVWGSLDWLPENRKVILDVSQRLNLQQALIAVFDSQISRGKDFDIATLGRRKSNATFRDAINKDSNSGITYAIDLIETVKSSITLKQFIANIIQEFQVSIIKNIS